jgi:phosphopantothenoylcysteine decarboxylase/phosphopantothenate--cysteine ligase
MNRSIRFLGNRSSGKQGHAIAASLAALGAKVTLISGPVMIPDPLGVTTVHVETALQMLTAVEAALPADIAVCAAAVADWRAAAPAPHKLKKNGNGPPALELTENPDILRQISAPGPDRPKLVIGFAAETQNLEENAAAKLKRKGCDWIVANNVLGTGIMGGAENQVTLITRVSAEAWPLMDKHRLASKLAARIAEQPL